VLGINKTQCFKASKSTNMPVIYINHSQAHTNQSGCLQWSDNDFMLQAGKHQRLKGDTMAVQMLNYASMKARDNVQKTEVQNYS
jgi:hypothetical protein